MSDAMVIREIDVKRAQLMVKPAQQIGKTPPERIRRLASATPTTRD